LHVFGTFVKNKVGIAGWIHIWVLYSISLVFICVFVGLLVFGALVCVWVYFCCCCEGCLCQGLQGAGGFVQLAE
jgi:hypothetical protein